MPSLYINENCVSLFRSSRCAGRASNSNNWRSTRPKSVFFYTRILPGVGELRSQGTNKPAVSICTVRSSRHPSEIATHSKKQMRAIMTQKKRTTVANKTLLNEINELKELVKNQADQNSLLMAEIARVQREAA